MAQLLISLAALTMGLALGFGTAWKMQESNVLRLQNRVLQADNDARAALAAKEAEHARKTNEAAHAARKREVALRPVVAAADRAGERLREQITVMRTDTIASAPSAPASDRANTLGDVLGECAREIGILAEKADRHVIDVQNLMQAWMTGDIK